VKLSKRIELLEHKFSDSEVTLWMANGSRRTVRTRRWIRMIGEILSGSITADTQAVIHAPHSHPDSAWSGVYYVDPGTDSADQP
jgi:hypothetical protein